MQQDSDNIVLEMLAAMEAHAASGEWDRVEELTMRLRSVVMTVPEQQRHEALLALRRSTEHVQELAHDARCGVTEKLCAIRRGRDVTKAYGGSD